MGCNGKPGCGQVASGTGGNKAYTPSKPKMYDRPSGTTSGTTRQTNNTYGSPRVRFSRGK